ncbi:MAG: response regulator [Chloroflexaceae bacterium]|nr:response regulator [Chloroflexaceae bacterium]
MSLYIETFLLHQLIDDLAHAVKPLMERNRNTFQVRYHQKPVSMHSDATRLRQILFQLLSNAARFTTNGSVVLLVDMRQPMSESGAAPAVVMSISDTGIGMTAERVRLLFQHDSHILDEHTNQASGPGQGLLVSRRLAHLLGGTITITSSPGQGTTVTLTIPTQLAQTVPPTPGLAAGGPKSMPERFPVLLSSPQRAAARGRRVLVVEDNALNQRLLRLMLERLGYTVDVVGNGREALAALGLKTYDVVLMDLDMPLLDGLETTRRIRADTTIGPQPCIIVVTGYNSAEDRAACLHVGANDVLAKPFTPMALASIMLSNLANPADAQGGRVVPTG